jgi:hypothetical protein
MASKILFAIALFFVVLYGITLFDIVKGAPVWVNPMSLFIYEKRATLVSELRVLSFGF